MRTGWDSPDFDESVEGLHVPFDAEMGTQGCLHGETNHIVTHPNSLPLAPDAPYCALRSLTRIPLYF